MNEPFDNCECLQNARIYDETLHIDLWYPDVSGNRVKKFVVGLVDVRAADDIRISYDKSRDGWVIEQASKFEWDADDEVCDPDWQEVAFVEAWGRCGESDRVVEGSKG